MISLKKFLLVDLLVMMVGATAFASTDEYEKCVYVSSRGDSVAYRLLRPEKLLPDRKYPLVLFLHGAGERGCDNQQQLLHGGQMWLNPVNREKYPTFVLAPQCPENEYWAYDERPASFVPDSMPIQQQPSVLIENVMELVGSVAEDPAVDMSRIYVMGLSMGGMATFDLAVRYPDVFAAAIPICGSVNPRRLKSAVDVNFRIYHGDADAVVTVEGSREAYKTLEALGANVTYVEFPGVTHGSWNPAFNDAEFMPWLFAQSKCVEKSAKK